MRNIFLFILLDYFLYNIIKLCLIEIEISKILFLSAIFGLMRFALLSGILFISYLLFKADLKKVIIYCSLIFPFFLIILGGVKNTLDINFFYNDFLPFIITWVVFLILLFRGKNLEIEKTLIK
ncbi:MAG: hypothetical protein RBR78_01100 [Flavobacteriaceae bacterium]|jgi:hypothetical protein|nr:hypothetical protein [Flavobacteriaceae bacterium]